MGCKVKTANAMFNRSHASQLACMYRFGASSEHMCLQGIVNGAMFIAFILYVAYHHLSQYHGGLGISSHSEEPHHGQLSLFFFYCLHLHVHSAQLNTLEPWLAWESGLEWAPGRGPGWSLSPNQASNIFY